ncbi:MAG: glutathione S-transferase family protein [Deltaproteobacteria bacterium]|nr:MAG: glutathione S-transferase family protein [Deltaproteobacteria bacterium]
MFKIYGFRFSFNTTKVLYVAEELGVDYEFINLNAKKGEHKREEYLKLHPAGKAPALFHEGRSLFESSAICRYMALSIDSPLFPQDIYQRCLVDQWLDYNTCHIGRWMASVYFERVLRKSFTGKGPEEKTVAEAMDFLAKQIPPVDQHFADNTFYLGDKLTIADFFSFAYIELHEKAGIDLTPYPNLLRWYEEIKSRPSISKIHSLVD